MREDRLLAEYLRRQQVRDRILAAAFPAQRKFILDPSKRKAALCTRRAGKTFSTALFLLATAFSNPRGKCLYLCPTKGMARDIIWATLKRLAIDLDLGIQPRSFNETYLSVTLPNLAVIKLSGADADSGERDKVLGQAYDLVIIDEAASWRADMWTLMESHLGPAMIETKGTIVMIGTPGDFIGPRKRRHMFYCVTTGKEWPSDYEGSQGEWTVHNWSAYDNPHLAEEWAAKVAQIERLRPLYKQTAEYKMMYEGRWAINPNSLVYNYDPDENVEKETPKGVIARVIGIDLGFNDATSFVVTGWADYDQTLHALSAEKKTGWIISQVAEECRRLMSIYPDARLVIDGAMKQAVEELRRRYQLPLIATEKKDKANFIRMFCSDLTEHKIKVRGDTCQCLLEEWDALVWDEHSAHPQELASCDNHAADAMLYAWRFARNYIEGSAPPPEPKPGSTEAMDRYWETVRLRQLAEEEFEFV